MIYFFIHILKTSGTTFMHVLEKDENNQIGYFYPSKKEVFNFEEGINESLVHNIKENPDWQKFNFIGGHFTFGIHHELKSDDFKYIGVVRDPVNHYLSLYKLYLRMPADRKARLLSGKSRPIEDLLKIPDSHNIQTFFLSGFSQQEIVKDKDRAYETAVENAEKYFAGIYPTERFDEGLHYFQHKIGLKPQFYQKKNVAPNTIEEIVSIETIEKIKQANDIDMRLYRHFSNKFNVELKTIPGITYKVMLFKVLNRIYGWTHP